MTLQRTLFRRVCVLTGDHGLPDATKPGSQYSELDLDYHRAMQSALASLTQFEFDFLVDHSQLLPRMLNDPPEFVLNLCDTGFKNVATNELHIPALLELLGIPYSGATPACMALCYDKSLVRAAAQSLGIPTPREMFIHCDDDLATLDGFEYPALIKPNRSDGSVGITQHSVVHDPDQAKSYVTRLHRELGRCDVLVQEYLSAAEYGLVLVGNPGCGFAELPLLTVDFSELPADLPPILGYESKTDPNSPYWSATRIVAAELPSDDCERLRDYAIRLFERLGCQDYARFDWRTRSDGAITLLEVNPNPAWDPDAKLAHMVRLAGKDYPQVFQMILEAAENRLANRNKT